MDPMENDDGESPDLRHSPGPRDLEKLESFCGPDFLADVASEKVPIRITRLKAFVLASQNDFERIQEVVKQHTDEAENNWRRSPNQCIWRETFEESVKDYSERHKNDEPITSEEESDDDDDYETMEDDDDGDYETVDNDDDYETQNGGEEIEGNERMDDAKGRVDSVLFPPKQHEPGKLAFVEFPVNHLLNNFPRDGWGKELLGSSYVSGKKFLRRLQPIMKEFAVAHSKIKYFEIINSLSQGGDQEFGAEMPSIELKNFLSMVIDKVKPQELFGSRGNDKRIKKAAFVYLTSPTKGLKAEEIVNKMDLKYIRWLNAKDVGKKSLILNNLLIWFITKYIGVLVRTFLYKSSTKDSFEPIFVPIKKWIKLREDYIEELRKNGTIELARHRANDGVPAASIKFFLKEGGLRPIFMSIRDDSHEKDAVHLKQILLQVWASKTGEIEPPNLHGFWHPIVQNLRKTKKPIYYVAADIANAYGSIIQDKLCRILDELLIVLPENFPVANFEVFNPNIRVVTDQPQIIDGSIPLLFPRNMITSYDGSAIHVMNFSRDTLMEQVKKYVKNQTVVINLDTHKLSRGVGQGLTLSSVLADIYYGTMEKALLSEFRSKGHLIRYVDDVLYVTDDKESAERFLAVVQQGLPEYNCTFNPKKTQSNLLPRGEDDDNSFEFVGYVFDANSGEVEPVYLSEPTEFEMDVDAVPYAIEPKIFRRRMLNFQSLKLTHLVLDPQINSPQRRRLILESAAKFLAMRCELLVTDMLGRSWIDIGMIGDVIDEATIKIMELLRLYERGQPMYFSRKWLYQKFKSVFNANAHYRIILGVKLEDMMKQLPKEPPPPHVNKRRRLR